ncbi:uncharacterized protein EI97DRAFT_434148 [Westerdykella ornata]|uniref:Uncharacterized protein n=1 Tax=Westerdykella ornata TaxID=318751 RepID=A0A6A6JGQ9_WESOR|nr:uncharacterized protein EI97DRAFT_434148 [Westerdykella ornata]KAF2275741.1 hypothetical protein EI97DRAFT_434148 [Westerdykella ornata]
MAPSPIENLPMELIQRIFFLSELNLSLPEASPYIGTKLAGYYVLQAICDKHLTPDPDKTKLTRGERSSMQSRLFRYRWMTWDFYKHWILKKYGKNGCLCGKSPETGCFNAQWPPDFDDPVGTMVFSRSHLPELSFMNCRLPNKLLHGAWTTDKVQFLRFLLWTTGMTVNWGDPHTRATILQGRREAVLERNLDAVELFNHNRRLGKPPNLDLVRFAVIDGGCDRSIVYDTMNVAREWGLRYSRWNCSILDDWCAEAIEAGNPKGRWLQLKLLELRATESFAKPLDRTEDVQGTPGYMNPSSGDYGNVEGDKLVILPNRWNKVSRDFPTLVRNPLSAATYRSR